MSRAQREKGKRGEREAAALIRDLLGLDVRRRVRQHDGDSDLLGIPGWAVEVKHCAEPRLREWWAQAVAQAGSDLPVLFYRLPRKPWRCVWPLSAALSDPARRADWLALPWTCDTTPEAWAAVVRERA